MSDDEKTGPRFSRAFSVLADFVEKEIEGKKDDRVE